MAIEIQIRRDTAANWTSVDPILAEGEFGLETDTNQLKIGDGVLAWTALAYFGGSGNPFDQDLNTTDPVVFAGLTNNAIIYPSVDGTAGQSIVTDGAGNLSFASGANPFDQSLNTTDSVEFAGLTNNAIIYPTSDGTAGQAIVTDGAGNLSFASAANPFDQDLNTTDPVEFTGLTSNGLIYPTADGTAGQGIVTDGAGNLSFANAGNPFDQDLNTTNEVVFDKVTLTGPIFEQQSVAGFSSGTLTLDVNEGNVFTHDLTANVTTVTISNVPGAGAAVGLTIVIEADGTARTISWPASFKWPSGTAPTITGTNNKRDVFVAFTYDGGTTFLAFVAGQNL